MSETATNITETGGQVHPMVMPYSVDDRGNVADFYRCESGECHRVAMLDREAGPQDDVDGVYTWDGDADVTAWAMANGYRWDIRLANRLARLATLETACANMGQAITFLDKCKLDADSSSTGAFRDACDWVESAARAIVCKAQRA